MENKIIYFTNTLYIFVIYALQNIYPYRMINDIDHTVQGRGHGMRNPKVAGNFKMIM